MDPVDLVKSMNDDFIAFDWDKDEDWVDQEPSASASIHATGQPQLFTKGKKRSADEMEAETGYSKKQRIAAESRVTPWAVDVDWDNCTSAADMCVVNISIARLLLNTVVCWKAEPRGRSFCRLCYTDA